MSWESTENSCINVWPDVSSTRTEPRTRYTHTHTHLHVDIISDIIFIELHEAVDGSARWKKRLVRSRRWRTSRGSLTVNRPHSTAQTTVTSRWQTCTAQTVFHLVLTFTGIISTVTSNLIHDFTAMTFSVKLAVFRKKWHSFKTLLWNHAFSPWIRWVPNHDLPVIKIRVCVDKTDFIELPAALHFSASQFSFVLGVIWCCMVDKLPTCILQVKYLHIVYDIVSHCITS